MEKAKIKRRLPLLQVRYLLSISAIIIGSILVVIALVHIYRSTAFISPLSDGDVEIIFVNPE